MRHPIDGKLSKQIIGFYQFRCNMKNRVEIEPTKSGFASHTKVHYRFSRRPVVCITLLMQIARKFLRGCACV